MTLIHKINVLILSLVKDLKIKVYGFLGLFLKNVSLSGEMQEKKLRNDILTNSTCRELQYVIHIKADHNSFYLKNQTKLTSISIENSLPNITAVTL